MNVRTLPRRVAVALLGLSSLAVAADNVVTNVSLPRYPAVSPDGKTISFSWHGDLFTAPVAGGLAERLTTNAFDELYSAFSPDGNRIAFTSARNGPANLFTANLDGTDIKQVSFVDRPMSLSQWGRDADGREKLFVTGGLDVEPFAVAQHWEFSPDGGEPNRITIAEGSTPCASPDGKKLLLARGVAPWTRRGYHGSQNRDVWLYDRVAKTFKQLTHYDGNDGKAKWLNDHRIVFVSDRENNTNNLFMMDADGDEKKAVALTHFKDAGVEDFDVSPKTASVVCSRWNRLYRLEYTDDTVAAGLDPARPVEIPLRASEEEADRTRFQLTANSVSESALSPDGKTMASIAYGELYVRGVDAKTPTHRVTPTLGGRKRDVAWSADGQRLLFVCDESGREEIYEATVKLTRTDVRRRAGETTTRSSAGADDEIGAATQPATQPGVMPPRTPEPQDDADQRRVIRVPTPGAPGAAGDASAAPATPPPATGELSRWGDALAFNVRKLFPAVRAVRADRAPTPSPDGKTLAFERAAAESGYEIVLHDEATGRDTVLVRNADSFTFRWSPDSRYVAYATEDRNNNSDIFIVPADGSEKSVNITRHPNADTSPRFSADGKVLAFLSNRTGIGDEMAAYSVNLDKGLDNLAPPELDAYFRDANASAKRRLPPTTRPTARTATQRSGFVGSPATTRQATTRPLPLKQTDLEDAYLRVRRLTNVRGSVSDLELSPAGDRIYFNGYLGPTRSLLSQVRGATDPTRLADAVDIGGITLTGDALYVVDRGAPRTPTADEEAPARTGGHASIVKLPGGEVETYDPADRLLVDLGRQSEQKFLEASRVMNNLFYNPKMNGVDWAANTQRYLELAKAAHTSDEFDYVANRFIGELNASHLGISAPNDSSPLAQPVGKLGIKTKPTTRPGVEVADVTPEGPADRRVMGLHPGDVITAINFQPVADPTAADAPRTLDEALLGKAGTEVVVTVDRDGKPLDLLLTPASTPTLTTLAYNRWRLATAKKVDELSHGRIGYIHIQGMNQPSLETYKRDLFAACDGKDGLIIDVRWNGGGSTADLLLASIMSPYHAYTVPRGAETHTDSYPTDRLFIPRFVGPIDMLCNERSFSNAEITAHAFKTLKRGNLVGVATAGGVISTGSATLLDGTTVRIPGRGWYTPDGVNMELHGARPDVAVPQTPEDEVARTDRQLAAAVDDLIKRLK